MIGLIQRVSSASVSVKGTAIGQINKGLLVLLGIEKTDTRHQARRLAERIIGYRVFPDEAGKMNLGLNDIQAGLLVVPQFTLVANTRKGMRPSFSSGASPEQGKQLFDYFVEEARDLVPVVQTGAFGADMQVSLVNDGPVTFWLQVTGSGT